MRRWTAAEERSGSAWSRLLRVDRGRVAGALVFLACVLPGVAAGASPLSDAPTSAAPDALRSTGRPFAIVDKAAATITVYRGDGSVAGRSPALIGRTPGDHVVPGVGERTQQRRLRPEDLTTPAGRFVSEPGRNREGEAIVWVDYQAAFAIHRLRPDAQYADRARRLASPNVLDRRASAGCVVVPGDFFDAVVQPLLGRGPAVVVVLPEAPAGLLAAR